MVWKSILIFMLGKIQIVLHIASKDGLIWAVPLHYAEH